jgi:predicted nucleic acid-binding protein
MIVLDSSIIIRFLRTRSIVIEQTLNEEEGLIPGVIRAEVLHGARSDADRTRLIAILDEFGRTDGGAGGGGRFGSGYGIEFRGAG